MSGSRIFLVYPPCEIFKNKIVHVSFPLGICSLGTYLRDKGHTVLCLDAQVEDITRRPLPDPEKVRIGLPIEAIVERCLDFKPDFVGISCSFVMNFSPSVDIARAVKKRLPGVRVVVGGSYASVVPERILAMSEADAVVLGEGEETFDRMTREPWETVPGVAWRGSDGRVVINPRPEIIPIDTLPIPDRDLLPVEKYIRIGRPYNVLTKKKRALEVMTSRGCTSRCSFCSAWGLWGTFRGRSPAKVLEELELLKSKYGIQEVQFVDDNLTADKGRARAIFQGMIDRKLGLAWAASNGVALHTLDEELIRLMRQSGCYLLLLPIESGSQRVLTQLMRKPLQIEKVPVLVDFIQRQGIDTAAFFLAGMPGETFEEIRASFDLAFRTNIIKSHFSFVMPIPGTPVYEQFLDYLRVTDPRALDKLPEIERDFDFKVPSIGSSSWTIEELQKFVARMTLKMYLKFMFLKPGIFFGEVARILIEQPMLLWEVLKFYARALTRVPASTPEKAFARRGRTA